MDRYNRGLMIVARILVAMVFILNGFGIINQAIPAKEMMERGVPPAIVPLFMIAGRLLEIVAGFGLALGLFPRWCALALFAFLLPATFVSLCVAWDDRGYGCDRRRELPFSGPCVHGKHDRKRRTSCFRQYGCT